MKHIPLSLPLASLLFLHTLAHADSMNGLRSSVARVGDVNGDGVPDLAVASRDRDRPERVWIVSGKDGARLLSVSGNSAGDRFGSEIGALGDWDRDGTPDLWVTARPRGRPNDGYRRLVSGRSGATLTEIDGQGAVGGARDVNDDGRLDLLLVMDVDASKAAIVLRSGKDDAELVRIPGHRTSRKGDAPTVDALAWIDDVDRDGTVDFVAARSSPRLDEDRRDACTHEVTAFSGRTGLRLWSTQEDSGDTVHKVALVRVDDTNADGVDELLVGVEDRSVRLVDGKSGAVLWNRALRAHVMYSLGSSLDLVGDIDRDGVVDWVIGADESAGALFDAGLCYVASGKTGETILALRADENFGFDACGLGDVNGDGVPDFAVGAERQRGWTPDDSSEPAVQVRSGKDASIVWMRRHVDLRE